MSRGPYPGQGNTFGLRTSVGARYHDTQLARTIRPTNVVRPTLITGGGKLRLVKKADMTSGTTAFDTVNTQPLQDRPADQNPGGSAVIVNASDGKSRFYLKFKNPLNAITLLAMRSTTQIFTIRTDLTNQINFFYVFDNLDLSTLTWNNQNGLDTRLIPNLEFKVQFTVAFGGDGFFQSSTRHTKNVYASKFTTYEKDLDDAGKDVVGLMFKWQNESSGQFEGSSPLNIFGSLNMFNLNPFSIAVGF